MNKLSMKKPFDRKKFLHSIFELFIVLLGTFIVSLGSGIFLTPFYRLIFGLTLYVGFFSLLVC
jgi:hypothetical protein